MSHTPPPGTGPDQPLLYEVRIKGHLGDRWNDWFDHMTITLEANGETTLTGPIVDQAALHGVLARIRDLGLHLLSVTRIHLGEAPSSEEQEKQLSQLPVDISAATWPPDEHD